MRWRLISIAAVCGAFWSVPAQAQQTVTTSTSTLGCSEACPNGTSALQPFDGTLGKLTNISLQVTGSKTVYTTANPIDPDSPASMSWSYSGPMTVDVNGTGYSFNISGNDTYSVGNQFAYGFTASGSGSFDIDPSLFSSFIGTNNQCNVYYPDIIGICVDGGPLGFGPGTSSFTSNNVGGIEGLDAETQASFALTYSFVPWSAVPEPSTWWMMLLGFSAIGMAVTKRPGSELRSWC